MKVVHDPWNLRADEAEEILCRIFSSDGRVKPVPKQTPLIPKSKTAKRSIDADRLHAQLQLGPMTTAQMIAWAGWPIQYANKVALILVLTGRADRERLSPSTTDHPAGGRMWFVYRAK